MTNKQHHGEYLRLAAYIQKHYHGNQAAFADSLGIARQQVSTWLRKGFVTIGHGLYSQLRELPAACPPVPQPVPLAQYVAYHYNAKQADFARAIDTSGPAVYRWFKINAVVANGAIYSEKRELPTPNSAAVCPVCGFRVGANGKRLTRAQIDAISDSSLRVLQFDLVVCDQCNNQTTARRS